MTFFFLLNTLVILTHQPPPAVTRSLLLFGNKEEPLIKQQLQLLEKDSSGLNERAVAIKLVNPADPLYKKYGMASDTPFSIILIGKDGSEKYRSNQLLSTTDLFALIDAMPVRQAEMRKKKKEPE